MVDTAPNHNRETSKQLSELTLLYQFSNTLLSTIHINKLTHLILTALTTSQPMLFERAMLFLRNEKTGVLQGMLGIMQENVEILDIIGNDSLSSHWDISEEVITRQRSTEFCAQVRATRIDTDNECPVIRNVIADQRLCHIEDVGCQECSNCGFIKHLGAVSFAAAPLVARGKSLGIIVVDNPRSCRSISRDDLHFLQLFANQAGMAMENSMLYNRIEDAHSNLRDARERLVHGQRLAAIGEMAANVAHELKNPLVTIGGFAGRLLKSLPADSQEHHYADTIVSEVCRLEKMLADILTFSRKPTICYSTCELGELLQESLNSCTTILEDHNITLTTQITCGQFPMVGDVHQLKQVFLNLILNASEAMSTGGTISVHTELDPTNKNMAVVRVADTGGGIAPDMLPQIFNPFFTTKQHGTGLGLAIVNRILLNHNGKITASNTESGALFTVTLPLSESIA
jgi:signal transduction histidine kinase